MTTGAKDSTVQEATEKAVVQKAASTEAATSVAEAVKRVADAAVAEVQKVKTPDKNYDFTFAGRPGGKFVITGPGNFSSSGTVQINGMQVETTEWSTSHIEGKMPPGVTSGEVRVIIDAKTVQHGYYKA